MGNVAGVVSIIAHTATDWTLAGHIHYWFVADRLHPALRDIAGGSAVWVCI